MVKITCEICGIEASLQQIGNSGNYFRCKHYAGMRNGKPQYFYHKVSKDYAEKQLVFKGTSIIKKEKKSIDLVIDQKTSIDPKKPEYSSILRNEVRSPGFEPGIISLEG